MFVNCFVLGAADVMTYIQSCLLTVLLMLICFDVSQSPNRRLSRLFLRV